MERFKAILITRPEESARQSVDIVEIGLEDLMDGEVVVEVEATTVNYKDGLAITGAAPVVRRFPMIPGVDLAGRVVSSTSADWKAGDRIVVNGWGLGEVHYGGFAGMARVKAGWPIRLPSSLSPADAMAIGTAGYTAMLATMALEEAGVTPTSGPVLVSGAAGGVGSVAVTLLASAGYGVVASTGRIEETGYLKELGASEIVARGELAGAPRALAKERWAGAIDTVGGATLANVLSMTRYGGAVAACGNAGGMDLPGSVAPFILRGVRLIGIDSVKQPSAMRVKAWDRLVRDLDRGKLAAMTKTIGFDDVIEAAATIVDGKVRGRLVVDMTGLTAG